MAEGVGALTLFPLLNLAIKQTAEAQAAVNQQTTENVSALTRMILEQLELLSLSPSIDLLLFIIVLAVFIKSVILLIANKRICYTAAQIATDQRLNMLRATLSQRWQYYLRNPSDSMPTAWRPRAQRSSTAFVFGATLITRVFQIVIHAPSR